MPAPPLRLELEILLLNKFQSTDDRYPLFDPLAWLIASVLPTKLSGADTLADVTCPVPLPVRIPPKVVDPVPPFATFSAVPKVSPPLIVAPPVKVNAVDVALLGNGYANELPPVPQVVVVTLPDELMVKHWPALPPKLDIVKLVVDALVVERLVVVALVATNCTANKLVVVALVVVALVATKLATVNCCALLSKAKLALLPKAPALLYCTSPLLPAALAVAPMPKVLVATRSYVPDALPKSTLP